MIKNLMDIAGTQAGLTLIIVVFISIGFILGIFAGYFLGFLFGRSTGKKLNSLKGSIDSLNLTLKKFQLREKQ